MTSLVSGPRIVYPRKALLELRDSKLSQQRPKLPESWCVRNEGLQEKDFLAILNKNWIPTKSSPTISKKKIRDLERALKRKETNHSIAIVNDVEDTGNPQESKRMIEHSTKIDETSLDNFEENSTDEKPNEIFLQKSEELNENLATYFTPKEVWKEIVEAVYGRGGMSNNENETPSTSTKPKRKRNRKKKPILLEVPSKDSKVFLNEDESVDPNSNISEDVFLDFMKKSFEQNSGLFKTTSFDEPEAEIVVGRQHVK